VENTLAFLAMNSLSESQAGPAGFLIKESNFSSYGATMAGWAAVVFSTF